MCRRSKLAFSLVLALVITGCAMQPLTVTTKFEPRLPAPDTVPSSEAEAVASGS